MALVLEQEGEHPHPAGGGEDGLSCPDAKAEVRSPGGGGSWRGGERRIRGSAHDARASSRKERLRSSSSS